MANADATFAWKILACTLRSEIAQLKANDTELIRLEARQVETRNRVIYLEDAITKLGGDLDEARKP
jgi:hypothetical protein